MRAKSGDLPFGSAVLFDSDSDGVELWKAQARNRCHFPRQNSMPDVVFREPIRKKNGMQTVAIVMPNHLKLCSVSMFVMPYTEVTKVSGRKNIETCRKSVGEL